MRADIIYDSRGVRVVITGAFISIDFNIHLTFVVNRALLRKCVYVSYILYFHACLLKSCLTFKIPAKLQLYEKFRL